jgi:anti-sigma regulatory factor (Ser/Thr protein kinase)
MITAENQIIRLTLLAKLDFLPGATALVREVLNKLGLEEKDARHLELVVEEACVNVIENAFEGETGTYDIAVIRRPGQIIVAVEDRGLPVDFKKLEEDGQESGLGMLLMKALADEVHFINLGRRGKRVELVKNLPEKNLDRYLAESVAEMAQAAKIAAPPYKDTDITIRLMRPDESINLSRCAYRCYGYTYSTDNFYFPERVRELLESGLMVSVVALDPENEIVGHLSIIKESPDSLVAEIGQAIVDPRCRGNGVLKHMGRFMNRYNRETCLFGTYGEAVTVHTYSQKSALSGGGKETGILLGFTPATMFFKDIQGEENRKRRPVVFFYTRMNEEPHRDVYLPAHHSGILHRIYENSGLMRNFISGPSPDLPQRSQVNVKVQTEASRAFMQVVEYGQDLNDLIKFRLKELCTRRVDCIYLDLPLSHPAVQRYCASMEMLGFFFGGILPEQLDGDCLRLQFINNAELELENVEIATDYSREMFKYVLEASGLATGKSPSFS